MNEGCVFQENTTFRNFRIYAKNVCHLHTLILKAVYFK